MSIRTDILGLAYLNQDELDRLRESDDCDSMIDEIGEGNNGFEVCQICQ